MGVRIDGDNITVPGQTAVQGKPTSLLHVARNLDVSRQRAYVQDLLLDSAAPIDLATITINSTKYIPVAVWAYNPNGNVSAANLGLYTAAGAGGTAIVTPAALASLTASTKFQLLTLTALTDVVTATILYPRLTVAAGAGSKCSIVIEFVDLSLI